MEFEVNQLTKIYGEQKAVNDVSFSVHKGEIVGFLGPNGAGKSTTMKIATCYLPPSSGTITVCGYDVVQSPVEVRRNVGYLPEHNPLYLDMYVHEYLQFIGSLHDLSGSKLANATKEMVHLVGLEREQHKKIGMLSKGYRQRVGLAQALIHDPQVLILDEPTTGLDPNQIVEIRNLIKNISENKTVILSTHIMQEVQALCSRAIIINRGTIVADGSVHDLRSGGTESIIHLEFENEIDSEKLAQLTSFKEFTKISNHQFILKAEQDLRKEIFHWSVENKAVLLEMRKEEVSLENVFQMLTNKPN